MAYDVPTAADLKTLFPAFLDVADVTVNAYLETAATEAADGSWREPQYRDAVMSFAAHRMAEIGIGAHGEAAGYARQGVSSIRSGNFAVALDADLAKSASAGELDATPYGRRYKRLVATEKGGPRVFPSTVSPGTAYGGNAFLQNNGMRYP